MLNQHCLIVIQGYRVLNLSALQVFPPHRCQEYSAVYLDRALNNTLCLLPFPCLLWSLSHLIFSLAPHPPLKLFAAVNIHLPSERLVSKESSSRGSNSRKSGCLLSMFPLPGDFERDWPSRWAHLGVPKTTRAPSDCIQRRDNKAAWPSRSQDTV